MTIIFDKNTDFFQPDIVSNHLNILSRIKDRKIVKLVRFRGTPPAIGFNKSKHPPSLEFSRGDGPFLMTLDSGLIVGIGYITEKISLSLWIEKTEAGEPRNGTRPNVKNPNHFLSIVEDPELFPVDSCDPIFSTPEISQFLEKKIVKITLVKQEITDIDKSTYFPKALYLPKEIGLIVQLETGAELIFSSGCDGHGGGLDIIKKEEISPRPYENFQYIPLDNLETVEANSMAQSANQLSSFSQSKIASPDPESLHLSIQLWERIPIRINPYLRNTKVRIDCQVDIFGLPSQVFIEIAEGISFEDIQIEHLRAARILFSYAEIVQLIHQERQRLHNLMKHRALPPFDTDHLFWRVQEVLDNMCSNIREEIPPLVFRSQLNEQDTEEYFCDFDALKDGLELCRELFIEISLESTPMI